MSFITKIFTLFLLIPLMVSSLPVFAQEEITVGDQQEIASQVDNFISGFIEQDKDKINSVINDSSKENYSQLVDTFYSSVTIKEYELVSVEADVENPGKAIVIIRLTAQVDNLSITKYPTGFRFTEEEGQWEMVYTNFFERVDKNHHRENTKQILLESAKNSLWFGLFMLIVIAIGITTYLYMKKQLNS